MHKHSTVVATIKALDGEICAPNQDTEIVSWLDGCRWSSSASSCVMKDQTLCSFIKQYATFSNGGVWRHFYNSSFQQANTSVEGYRGSRSQCSKAGCTVCKAALGCELVVWELAVCDLDVWELAVWELTGSNWLSTENDWQRLVWWWFLQVLQVTSNCTEMLCVMQDSWSIGYLTSQWL